MLPEDVASALSDLLATMAVRSREAVMSVAPFYVFTVVGNTIDPGSIPARPGAYKLQGAYLKDGRYFFTAIPRDIELAYQQIAESAGLRLLRLEPTSFALAGQFHDRRGKVLVVDEDQRCTTYIEISNGRVDYVFHSDFGYDYGAADVIMNKAKEIAATRGINQLVFSNSVFNIANGLQKVSQQAINRHR